MVCTVPRKKVPRLVARGYASYLRGCDERGESPPQSMKAWAAGVALWARLKQSRGQDLSRGEQAVLAWDDDKKRRQAKHETKKRRAEAQRKASASAKRQGRSLARLR